LPLRLLRLIHINEYTFQFPSCCVGSEGVRHVLQDYSCIA
jgi:hypothetical protein